MAYQPLWFILFTNPSARAGYDTRSIFKRSLTGLHSEFSFSSTSCLTKAEEPSLSHYLPVAGGRITGFIPFPRVLVLCGFIKWQNYPCRTADWIRRFLLFREYSSENKHISVAGVRTRVHRGRSPALSPLCNHKDLMECARLCHPGF